MDKKYIELFSELTQKMAVCAEQVEAYENQNGNKKNTDISKEMKEKYLRLYAKINETYEMTKEDAVSLYVAASIMAQRIEQQIKDLKTALVGYQTDLIPKLERVIDAKTEEASRLIAKEKFILDSNK